MKNSIKTLSLILLALLAANTSFAVNYTYNGTTWTPAFSTLTNSDNVTVTGGTWTVTTSTNLGSLTLNGGNLTLSNTLIANNGGGTTYTPVTVSGTSTITSSSSSSRIGTLTVNSTGTLTFAGSVLRISSLSLSSGSLIIPSTGFRLSNNPDMSISGNSTISSTGVGFLDNAQSQLTINNGGQLTINNAEVLIQDLTFNSSANDIITTNGGILAFDNNDNSISGSETNRHVNGTIRVYVDENGKNSATYPLGNGTVYAPVRLSSMNGNNSSNNNLSNVSGNYGTHFFTLSYVGSINNNKTFDNTLVSASGHEYWNISTSSTNPAVRITLYLNITGSVYGKTRVSSTTNLSSNLELAQINSSTNKWTVLSASVNSINGGTAFSAQSSSFAPNSSFTFGSTNSQTTFLTPLPVSIIDFSAKANDNNIEVKWSTASEKDNAAFVVEKSIDGQIWSAIGTVKGAKTSNVVNNYGLVDFKAVAGVQYYRLKQIDLDGTVSYSKAIAVNFSKASTLNVNLFPNPAKDALNITTENNASGEVNIQILNSMGETVYNQVVQAGLVQTIDIASFIPGVYYVTVIAEGETKIIRLLKN